VLKIKLLETETCVYKERVLLIHIETQISLVYLFEDMLIIFLYGSAVTDSFWISNTNIPWRFDSQIYYDELRHVKTKN
jgi:hypothetical protein